DNNFVRIPHQQFKSSTTVGIDGTFISSPVVRVWPPVTSARPYEQVRQGAQVGQCSSEEVCEPIYDNEVLDLGIPLLECQFYGALYWADEQVQRRNKGAQSVRRCDGKPPLVSSSLPFPSSSQFHLPLSRSFAARTSVQHAIADERTEELKALWRFLNATVSLLLFLLLFPFLPPLNFFSPCLGLLLLGPLFTVLSPTNEPRNFKPSGDSETRR
ncbi:hypothetical protein LINPERPRIM_LOCUS2549, partial [Linum perenne]